MKRRLITVLAFAVLTALVASTAVYRVIADHARPVKPVAATVLVAARDLDPGKLVRDADIRAVPWQGTVSAAWLTQREEIVGRGVIARINSGEPFSPNRLAAKGAGGGLAAAIPTGMRAVAVRVDEVVGVSGFVVPGMRVDVLSSGTLPGDRGDGKVTRTILQNIEVLSAGQNFERDVQGKPATVQVVNLLVTPEQAELLSLAGTQTKIQLALRNPSDTQTVATVGATTGRLLGLVKERSPEPRRRPNPAPVQRAAQPAPEKPKVEPPPTVEVIHGTKKEMITVRREEQQEVRQ